MCSNYNFTQFTVSFSVSKARALWLDHRNPQVDTIKQCLVKCPCHVHAMALLGFPYRRCTGSFAVTIWTTGFSNFCVKSLLFPLSHRRFPNESVWIIESYCMGSCSFPHISGKQFSNIHSPLPPHITSVTWLPLGMWNDAFQPNSWKWIVALTEGNRSIIIVPWYIY